MGSPQRVLVVLRHAPHDSSWLREGLDVALVAAALGQDVTLLFLGDGVEALRGGQQVGPLGHAPQTSWMSPLAHQPLALWAQRGAS